MEPRGGRAQPALVAGGRKRGWRKKRRAASERLTDLLLAYVSEEQDEDDEAEQGLNREESFRIWALCEALEWKHLPFSGSLLEQPDWFLEDAMLISRRRKQLKDAPNVGETDGARWLGDEYQGEYG